MPHSSRVAVLETAIETGTRGSRPSLDPVSDESTPKRDGRIGRRPESHGKRPFSHEISSKSHKKRKASLMKDSGNTYEATHIRPSIKKETGLPVDDSLSSSGSTSSGALSIKQKVSTGKVRQGRRNTIGNGGATIFGPPPRRHDSSSMVEMEVEWPGNDRREGSNVKNRRGSSSLTEPSMWDVSDSEMHTSDIKDESSDGESVGSDFSIGRDRQESVRSSGGSDYRRREKFNDILSRRGTVQDQEYVSSEGPTEPATNGHHRTEQNTLTRRIPHNHDNRIEDNSIAIPANVVTDRNSEYTVTGRRRQRAAAITQISARDISHSWRTASAADKMLVKMKQRGCSWLKIRKAWKELTGEWPAQSTLPNRYSRVKDNLTRLGPGEGKRLLDAVAEVEAQFQRSKWRMIAETMERTGAVKYSPAFIMKKYNQLSARGKVSGSLTEDESAITSESDSNLEGDRIIGHRQVRAGPTTVESPQESRREAPP